MSRASSNRFQAMGAREERDEEENERMFRAEIEAHMISSPIDEEENGCNSSNELIDLSCEENDQTSSQVCKG